jgi:hypothetical protein
MGRAYERLGDGIVLSEIVEVIKAVAPAVTALAAAVGAYVGIRGLNRWQAEMMGRRRTELAEEVLAGFYQARDIVAAIRSPAGYAGESADRKAPPNESEHVKRDRDAAFVPIARYQTHQAFFSELFAKRYRMRAIFGVAADGPFNALDRCVREILASANTLMGMAGRQGAENEDAQKFRREREAVIWSGFDPDKLASRVEAAVKEMEQLCQPLLEGKRNGHRPNRESGT